MQKNTVVILVGSSTSSCDMLDQKYVLRAPVLALRARTGARSTYFCTSTYFSEYISRRISHRKFISHRIQARIGHFCFVPVQYCTRPGVPPAALLGTYEYTRTSRMST